MTELEEKQADCPYCHVDYDLPVIPKVVGEILQSVHGQTDLLGMLDTARNGHKVSEPLAWIIANQNTFATA